MCRRLLKSPVLNSDSDNRCILLALKMIEITRNSHAITLNKRSLSAKSVFFRVLHCYFVFVFFFVFTATSKRRLFQVRYFSSVTDSVHSLRRYAIASTVYAVVVCLNSLTVCLSVRYMPVCVKTAKDRIAMTLAVHTGGVQGYGPPLSHRQNDL